MIVIVIKLGNIITFEKTNGEVITHRIKEIIYSEIENSFITQGDNNNREDDEIVRYKQIIGKVVYTIPQFGIFVRVLKNKFFFSFSLGLLIVILLYDRKIMKRKEERKAIRQAYEENK